MWKLLAGLGVVTGLAVALAPVKVVETEVIIAADPDRVWRVLTDGAAYPEWNPFVKQLVGDIRPGARLDVEIAPAVGKSMRFRPEVLVARAGAELRWLGRLWVPGLFDGEHYFRIEAVPGGARLVHGERFSGLLLWGVDPLQFKRNFEAMNAALKARAEAV